MKMGTGDFSAAIWLKRAGFSANYYFMCYGDNSDPRWEFYFLSTDYPRFLADDGTTAAAFNMLSTITDTNWHLLGFSWDRSESDGLHLYLDGSPSGAGRDMSGVNLTLDSTTNGLMLGCRRTPSPSSNYNGNIDEVSIWKGIVLSDAQHAEIWNSGAPADLTAHSAYANLVAWWRMGDGDTFPTLTDNRGSNNGTMTNMESGDIVADVP